MPSSLDKFARRQRRLERDVMVGAIAPSLPYSSIDGGSLELRDALGNTQGIVGQQYDGTVTIASVGGSPIASPSTPLVTPAPGGLALYWDGTYVDDSVTRMDFRRVTFHAVADVDDFDALDPAQIVGEITIATGGEVFASLPPTEWFIFAVAWTDAGKFSFESDVAYGTPLSIVDEAQWQEHEDALTQLNTVSLPSLQDALNGTVTVVGGWQHPDDPSALNGNALYEESILAQSIGAYQITVDKLAVNSVTAFSLAADAITAKHTLTGPTVQTSPSVARGIKLAGSNLTAYDGSGNANVVINGTTGTLTVSGPNSSITGAVIRTAASPAERLEINTGYGSEIKFFSGNVNESIPSSIRADDDYYGNANTPYLFLQGGVRTGFPGGRYPATLSLLTRTTNLSEIEGYAQKVSLYARDTLNTSNGNGEAFITLTQAAGASGSLYLSARRIGSSSSSIELVDGKIAISGDITGTGGVSPATTKTFGMLSPFNGTVSVKKFGAVVTIAFQINRSSGTGNFAHVGTVPSDSAPPVETYFWAVNSTTGAQEMFYVTTTGELHQQYGMSAGVGAYGSITYMV